MFAPIIASFIGTFFSFAHWTEFREASFVIDKKTMRFERQARLFGPHSNFVLPPDDPHEADQQTSDAQRYDEDNDVLSLA